jgi:hypothetical protein
MAKSLSQPFATNLEQKARQLGWTADKLRQWLYAQGYTEREIEATFSPTALSAIVEPSMARLLPKAAVALGWSVKDLAKRITLDVVNADDVACHVHLHNRKWGKHKLRVYAGFLFFANKVIRALANGLLEDAAPPIPHAEEEAAMLLRAFYTSAPLPGAWSIAPYKLRPQQEYLIAFLSGYVREAALAHELGHIVYALGHRDSENVRKIAESFTTLQNAKWGKDWPEEFAADFLGVTFLGRPTENELSSAHGMMILLFIIELLEMCGTKVTGGPTSHPPCSARRGLLLMPFPWLANASALDTVDATCRRILQLAQC